MGNTNTRQRWQGCMGRAGWCPWLPLPRAVGCSEPGGKVQPLFWPSSSESDQNMAHPGRFLHPWGGLAGAEAAMTELSSSTRQRQQETERCQAQVSGAGPCAHPRHEVHSAGWWLGSAGGPGQPLPAQSASTGAGGITRAWGGHPGLLQLLWSWCLHFPQQPHVASASLQRW